MNGETIIPIIRNSLVCGNGMKTAPIIIAAMIIFPYSYIGKLTFASFKVFHINVTIINNADSVVAIAAPLIPNGGTRTKLKIKSIVVPTTKTYIGSLGFPRPWAYA